MKGLVDSWCFRLSATWAMTPAPALCSHSLFTWINNISSYQENKNDCMHKDLGKEVCRTIHEYCYGQRMAKMLNESWHQLSSIPTFVTHVSFPLIEAIQKTINTKWSNARFTTTYLSQYNQWLPTASLTFYDIMIFCCVFCAGRRLCSLLCLGCFWRKLGALRWYWGAVLYVYNVLITIQGPPRGLPL